MLDIDYKEFTEFFDTKLYPKISEAKAEIDKSSKLKNIKMTISYIAILTLIILGYCHFIQLSDTAMIFNILIILAIIIVLIFFAIMPTQNISIDEEKKILKGIVYNIFMEAIGLEYITDKKIISQNQKWLDNFFKKNNLYNNLSSIIIDDLLTGNINGKDFSIIDANIDYNYSQDENIIGNFHGIILTTKISQAFECETMLKYKNSDFHTDVFDISNYKKDKKIINLEDAEFEKKFEVYSTNEKDAQNLLTPQLKDSLKNLHAEIFFSNKINFDSNVLIFIYVGGDHFEVNYDNLFDQEQYFKIYNEIKDIIKIVPAIHQ